MIASYSVLGSGSRQWGSQPLLPVSPSRNTRNPENRMNHPLVDLSRKPRQPAPENAFPKGVDRVFKQCNCSISLAAKFAANHLWFVADCIRCGGYANRSGQFSMPVCA
jgi:hypothetical protein